MPDFWSWSLRLFRLRGITVFAHWSLLLIALLVLVHFSRSGLPAYLVPVTIPILLGSILLHELAHAFAAKLVGGNADRIVLSMLGGLTDTDEPMRPWPKFSVAAAGPLATAMLVGITWAVGEYVAPRSNAGVLLGFAFTINLWLLIFNLLPCHPLDGGRMLSAALWPLIGLRRAVTTLMVISYPVAVGVTAWGIWQESLFLSFIGIWLLASVFREHQTLRQDGAHAFGYFVPAAGTARRGGWFGRWRERQAARAQERRERDEEAEGTLLDGLLTKVSSQGLPSLTQQERLALERISRRQRERQESL